MPNAPSQHDIITHPVLITRHKLARHRIIGENRALPPTVFRVKWPPHITAAVISDSNPTGTLTNSDLEMAGLLLLWLAIEYTCPTLSGAHIALFSDNNPTVHWVRRLASHQSKIASQLIRALTLWLSVHKASPLTPLHIAGVDNQLTDIPSRSFGTHPKWFCETDTDLCTLFNASFPLPNQASWTLFQPSSEIVTKTTSILQTQLFCMDDWRRLPKLG